MLPYVPNTALSGSEWNSDRLLRRHRTFLTRSMATRDFTQSVMVTGNMRESPATESRWVTESCQVVPRTAGGFQIYQPSAAEEYRHRHDEKQADMKSDLTRSIEMAASKYKTNIRNPEMRKKQQERLFESIRRRDFIQSAILASRRMDSTTQDRYTLHESLLPAGTREYEFQCSCKEYHSHPLCQIGTPVNKSIAAEVRKREKIIATSELGTTRVDTYDDPRNIFWSPGMSFHPYKHGDKIIEFSSLWPKEVDLKNHLKNSGIQLTILRGAVLDLCKLSITCGPVHLLRCLIDLSLIRKYANMQICKFI